MTAKDLYDTEYPPSPDAERRWREAEDAVAAAQLALTEAERAASTAESAARESAMVAARLDFSRLDVPEIGREFTTGERYLTPHPLHKHTKYRVTGSGVVLRRSQGYTRYEEPPIWMGLFRFEVRVYVVNVRKDGTEGEGRESLSVEAFLRAVKGSSS